MRQDDRAVPLEIGHAETAQRSFLLRVYHWMTLGLALTGIVALYMASKPEMVQTVMTTPGLFFGLLIGELVLVFYLAARVMRMSPGRAMAVFLLYSALNGVTFSVIFLAYTKSTIASAFFVTAGTFAATSLYGYVTKRDLSGMGSFLFMGLIGIIIASIVNMFLGSHGMAMIISYIGVIVFVGLTAYDTQKLKAMAMSQPAGLDAATIRKGSILGALTLYLDFILMFQYLLMIFGGSRD